MIEGKQTKEISNLQVARLEIVRDMFVTKETKDEAKRKCMGESNKFQNLCQPVAVNCL